jgi:hypothetical protein
MEFECDSDGSTDMGDESEPESDTDVDDTQARQHLEPYEHTETESNSGILTKILIKLREKNRWRLQGFLVFSTKLISILISMFSIFMINRKSTYTKQVVTINLAET